MNDIDFLRLAYKMALHSPDPSTQNGAILVAETLPGVARGQEHVIGTGCNEFPCGVVENKARWERPLKYSYVEHAERAAVYEAAKTGRETRGATLYVCWYACADCARAVIMAGVKEVVGHDHPLHASRQDWAESVRLGREMLSEAGVAQRLVRAELGVEFRFNGELVRA